MYLLIAIVFIAADRITKMLITNDMTLGQSRQVLGSLVDFTYIHNNGSAFSMFQGKQTFLIALTVILMIGVIIYWIIYKKSISIPEHIALALILGGGIGNLIDRIMYGYVIDFIDIHFIPIFNVADIAITCGCILFAITVLFQKKK